MANQIRSVPPKAGKQVKVKSPATSPMVSRAEPPQDQLNALISLYSRRAFAEVVRQAAPLIAEFPGAAILYNILGAAHAGLRNLDGAAENFQKALKIRPDYAEAHSSLGIALQGQGRFDEAIASYDKALQIKPDFAEAHNNRGAALKEQGRLDEAIACFGRALEITPRFAEAHNNLGAVLRDQGRMDEAATSFRRALQIRPNDPEAHSNLCGLLEKQNNIEEFEQALGEATRLCGEEHLEILFRLAQLASRKNQHEAAVGYLERIPVEKIQPSLRAIYFSLLGKSCDKLGRSDEAFSAFAKQNELTLASAEAKKFDRNRFLSSIQRRKNAWATDVKPNWPRPVAASARPSPAFLVGFPRSGTTLLDTILRSHPEISVVEEKPMVGAMVKGFKQRQTIEFLGALSESNIRGLQDAYFEELKLHLDQSIGGKLVVDKFPLNITHVGSIHRVFPDAKFILALRHPCDCVLSCFMQTFELNGAMINFLSLEQSARLYATVMELWALYRQKLSLDVHVVKYEELVQDLEGTCRPLISFLGFEWDDNLHNYQKTALERGRIHTPSYSQVVQPLYKRASGRWTNYRKQMEPVLPVLQPWIDAFGY
jgi:tetratricopeptide (TPR) repeat protein